MKGRFCYTTRDNSEVKLRRMAVVVMVSTQTHQSCIHKYCDFNYWWTPVAWYLTDQKKYDRVLNKLVTHVLCYVKNWMTVGKRKTSEVD